MASCRMAAVAPGNILRRPAGCPLAKRGSRRSHMVRLGQGRQGRQGSHGVVAHIRRHGSEDIHPVVGLLHRRSKKAGDATAARSRRDHQSNLPNFHCSWPASVAAVLVVGDEVRTVVPGPTVGADVMAVAVGLDSVTVVVDGIPRLRPSRWGLCRPRRHTLGRPRLTIPLPRLVNYRRGRSVNAR